MIPGLFPHHDCCVWCKKAIKPQESKDCGACFSMTYCGETELVGGSYMILAM